MEKRKYTMDDVRKLPLGNWSFTPRINVQVGITLNPHNVGRNTPCPCGSGKKFKHCHLGKGVVVEGSNRPKDALTKDGVPYTL